MRKTDCVDSFKRIEADRSTDNIVSSYLLFFALLSLCLQRQSYPVQLIETIYFSSGRDRLRSVDINP